MASKCISKLARSQPPSVSLNSLNYCLQVRSITASKCISKLAGLRPPSASPNLLDYSLRTRLDSASKCISKLARSRPPSISPNSLDYGLQVSTITATKCISNFARSQPPSKSLRNHGGVYRDTVVTEVERVTGSKYSADPGVDRHHLISISSHLIIKWNYTLYLSPLLVSLALSAIWWIHAIVWDSQCRVVSSLLTQFLCSSNQNCSSSWILFGSRERCGGVLMVGSLPSSSIIPLQRPPNGASLKVLSMGVAWCSTDYARVPSAARLTVCIYRERLK